MMHRKQQKAIHANIKKSIKLHPELAQNKKGWNFSSHMGVMNYGEQKDFAKREHQHHKTAYPNKTGKLRYGRRRKIDSTYGYQRRYQESSAQGKHPPDAIGKVNMKIFERK